MKVNELIKLGELHEMLRSPRLRPAFGVVSVMDAFIKFLDHLGFKHTGKVAISLNDLKPIKYGDGGIIAMESADQMQRLMKPISNSLEHETVDLELIIVNQNAVIRAFIEFIEAQKLTDIQNGLAEELTYCMRIGALKASIILAWNFSFDYIRQWVFDNHITQFNSLLTSKYIDKRTSNPIYDPIVVYEDFFNGKPGERTFLEVLEYAGILDSKKVDKLKAYLHSRNDNAHSIFVSLNLEQVNGYIKNLLDIIASIPIT